MRRGPRQYPLSSDLRPARVEGGTFRSLGLVLRSIYPCCGGPARFATVDGIPVEVYGRRCPKCDTRWTVRRARLISAEYQLGKLAEVRADRLDWETALVEIHARNRRALLGLPPRSPRAIAEAREGERDGA
jgi:hypothetical protein